MGHIMTRGSLLQIYLTSHRRTQLRPGRFDCALFAADWVRTVSGLDLAGGWRGAYRTLEDGHAQLAQAGFANLGDFFASHLTEVPGWMHAQVGDVAVVIENDEEAMGIAGGSWVHCLGVQGLDVVPISRAVRVVRP